MSGAGVDPEAISVAIADLFNPDVHGVTVYAFPPAGLPNFPAFAVFPGAPLVQSYRTRYAPGFGELNFVLKAAFTTDAEDAYRSLYRMLSQDAGHDVSIPDILHANRTLDGLVEDVAVTGDAGLVVEAGENGPVFVASIPLAVHCKRKA